MQAKVGRNTTCPCGSGKKYKRCHGDISKPAKPTSSSPPNFMEKMVRQIQMSRGFKELHGAGRPIVHANFNGMKIVAVGSELHWMPEAKCQFFPDFLTSHLMGVLTPEWYAEQRKLPLADQHLIAKWYVSMCHYQRTVPQQADGTYRWAPSGAMMAWYRLAYDLYLIRHNAKLQDRILDRIKHKDQFQGARYELCVAAAFVTAGFDINYEDENDGSSKHAEFIAVHKVTGIELSVEAKSRHRHGVLDYLNPNANADGVRVAGLVSAALKKEPPRAYIVCVDVNLPDSDTAIVGGPWFQEVRATLDAAEKKWPVNSFPASATIFTNDPSHYRLDALSPLTPSGEAQGFWAFGKNHGTARYPISEADMLQRLLRAFAQRGNIPNEFPDARFIGN